MKFIAHFCIIFAFTLTGCSFQSERPAPVESLNSPIKPSHDRGSITSSRYKVKQGDTLYSISWGANKDFAAVALVNNLRKPYTIYPGQVLSLSSKKTVTNTNSANKPSKTAYKAPVSATESNNKQSVSAEKNSEKASQPASKKQLDQVAKPAYSVTSGQQDVNRVVHRQESTLPKKVSRWFWPVKGKVIGTFSAKEQGNKGIKIAGNRGDAIKAAASGRVVYAGSALRGYGNLVIIKHSDDYLSAYAHADKILVKEKQVVNVGQTVAEMGNTGTNRVILHFEIRYHGKSVNPLKYLPKQ
ncbi:peptidoglycan DD-metalloendopeptidase family protein [Shewanella sp. KX20019]|uniref:peptidoglycan DD-metalloendopeptidase family protein n=1 Tax=Shewanella sp. KX20019 TaxID=2803864 RepID=UPI00192618AF|nr:peptidoglycan DD-metalloendopeptidase family protein [Shewanella sp. KX20019]QQX81621.1 peptidoglycan DD-metalloendopeptidase family protein [Shewanella sp. KX20019]